LVHVEGVSRIVGAFDLNQPLVVLAVVVSNPAVVVILHEVDVQTPTANEHRRAGLALELAPEMERLVREKGVGRVQKVVAERGGAAVVDAVIGSPIRPCSRPTTRADRSAA
jgi:hypothetical protein